MDDDEDAPFAVDTFSITDGGGPSSGSSAALPRTSPLVFDNTTLSSSSSTTMTATATATTTMAMTPNSGMMQSEASPNGTMTTKTVGAGGWNASYDNVVDNFYKTTNTNSTNKKTNSTTSTTTSTTTRSANTNSSSNKNKRAPNQLPSNHGLTYTNIRSNNNVTTPTVATTTTIEESNSLEFDFVDIQESDATATSLDTTYPQNHHLQKNTQLLSKPFDWLSYSFQNGKGGSDQDILSLLLSDDSKLKVLTSHCQGASRTAQAASLSLKQGNVSEAVGHHVTAAKLFKDCALQVKRSAFGTTMPLLSYSLLVLSHAQARNANLLLKHGRLELPPVKITSGGRGIGSGSSGGGGGIGSGIGSGSGGGGGGIGGGGLTTSSTVPPSGIVKAIRDSMNVNKEADMTDSIFFGDAHNTTSNATTATTTAVTTPMPSSILPLPNKQLQQQQQQANNKAVNPVDDMMELEKELRDMDMTLEMGVGLGSSVASLGGGALGAGKKSLGGESFCVVPPENGAMSSSIMWASGLGKQHHASSGQLSGMAGRGRPKRSITVPMQSNHLQNKQHITQPGPIITPDVKGGGGGGGPIITPGGGADLGASWWGQASALASSTTSISNSMVGIRSPSSSSQETSSPTDPTSAPANTKQLVKLLDSLKAIGDENAALMREVEGAEKARNEAKAAREAMKQFKADYRKRFATLKAALDKFRKEYPDIRHTNATNVVSNSEHVKTSMTMELQKRKVELQRRDQVIKKLQSDLKEANQKIEKKDIALTKFERFYREVKMRSAARQKERAQQV